MSKIYIVCPANTVTGGPELLHQLNYKIKELNYQCSMYYTGIKEGVDPTPEQYKVYNVEYDFEIEDSADNYMIVPEICTNLLKKYKKINKVIWWLSVDNYFVNFNNLKAKIKSLGGLMNFNYKNEEVFHLSQSNYATDFLKKEGISEDKIIYLSDYINKTFIEKSSDNINKEKKDYILYNPKKGYEYTKKIIDKSSNLNWKPLINLTPEEMSELMQESKVYIDFGNHPGKDRIPREAAISGCCIITGLRGSARFKQDVPIDSGFKFEDSDENISNVLSKIEYLIKNYDTEKEKFNSYRDFILSEEKKFEIDVKSFLDKIYNN